MRLSVIIALALTTLTGAAPAQSGAAPFQVAETGRGYGRLADAVAAIDDAQGTIVIAPGTYRQCAIQTAGHISYRAQVPGEAIFDSSICEGKAALVLRGRSAAVDGIVFQRIADPGGNGAGIHVEKGTLSVTRSVFRNSNQAISSAEDPAGEISIDQSTFLGLGRCDRGLGCAHSIHIGNLAALTITRSRFERGKGGHYVQSRAARAIIQNNAFDDTRGQQTSYMIDLPGGTSGMINGNVFVQGASKQDHSAFIAIAAEGESGSSNALAISGNDARIAPGLDRNTIFVAFWGEGRPTLGSNRLGRGLTPFEKR
jgi:hypothetical protein